jgi:glycine C-acetyltransferase
MIQVLLKSHPTEAVLNPSSFEARTRQDLAQMTEAGTLKRLRYVDGPMGAVVRLEDQGEVIALCSNDYLGLASHPEVVEAGIEGLKRYGAGTASVRFICGTFTCHRTIEKQIAELHQAEAALTYVACWNANQAVMSTITGPEDVILSDELNHASIIDGCRLARPQAREVYRHADMADLEEKLKAHAGAATRWVVTDGVFSMEGAVAPLPELIALCKKYDARLVMDDCHGVGVLGATGRGTAEHYDVLGQVDIHTGTLGKALGGAAGGYVTGSPDLIELLVQRSRPGLFSNALPATVACSAGKAIEILRRDDSRMVRLRNNIAALREGLTGLGFTLGDSPTAILPIHIGDEAEAIRASERLLENGVWVVAFGFPVVPKGKARLRVQVSAALEPEHIEQVLAAFAKL